MIIIDSRQSNGKSLLLQIILYYFLVFMLIKNIIIVTSLILAVTAEFCNVLDVDFGFETFCRVCNKNYADETERQARRQIYLDSCEAIKEMKKQNLQHEVGSHCNSDRRMEEMITAKMETPPVGNGKSLTNRQKILSSGINANSTSNYINWRSLGKVTSVKDQGSCGSCWAFSTTALVQSILSIYSNASYDLSQQFTLECTYAYDTRHNYYSTCSGGVIDDALTMQVNVGLPDETTYPYAAASTSYGYPRTISSCFSSPVAYRKMSYNGVQSSWSRYDNATAEQIRILLYESPLAVAYYVENSFYNYKSGVYSCPVNSSSAYARLNHAMLLVGQDENGNYILKNSWGTTWGVQGFVTISAAADCGISAYVYSINFLWSGNLFTHLALLVAFFLI